MVHNLPICRAETEVPANNFTNTNTIILPGRGHSIFHSVYLFPYTIFTYVLIIENKINWFYIKDAALLFIKDWMGKLAHKIELS